MPATPDYTRYRCLKIEKRDSIATVWLDRAETRNQIDRELHHELRDIWPVLGADRDVNAILLTGAGDYFSVGGNVKAMLTRPGGDVFEEGEMIEPRSARQIVRNILDCEKPIVCAINGDCVGLAATVALLCDITICAEDARIGDPHVRIGLVAGDGGAVIWPLLVGPNRAKEFLMRGTLLRGADASRIGLVNYAVPRHQVLEKATAIAHELADGPPWAIRWTKLVVNKVLKEMENLVLDASFALEMATFRTEDHREAVQAFIQKRKPRFTGR
jgi:enoyl-CoA hydratase/carnithine racemase